MTEFTDGQSLYWVFYRILSLPSTWLCFGLTCLTALIPDICYKVIENMVYEFKQLSKRKFKEKLACYRDLPDNYEGQKRKRYGRKMSLLIILVVYVSSVFLNFRFADKERNPVYEAEWRQTE